jgi:Arc/MetJ-type ribon-helix-helix transcriptional regulator
MEKQKTTNWSLIVSRSLDTALEQAITQDSHSTKSEFIREAVRDKLKELGYKPKIDFFETPKTEKEIEV